MAGLRDVSQSWLARGDASAIGRTWQRLIEIEFVDRSVALAAKAFVSLFPLLLVSAALAPTAVSEGIRDTLMSRLGLAGASADIVRGAFNGRDAMRSSTGVLGVILTVLFAVSFTTALQRIYLRAWRRPARGGLRDKRRGLVWLAMIVAFLGVVGAAARLFTGGPGSVLAGLVSLVGSTLVWWWTAHTLLRGDVRWRPLLPTAIATGAGSWLYAVAAAVWMPRVVEGNVSQFGFVGVALSFVTWLTGFGFLLVVAAAFAPALAEGDGRVARWLRGAGDDVLEPGAAAALPGPASPPRLIDLLRRTDGTAELTES